MSLKPLPPLSKEEEAQLFAAGGPKLLETLIRSNLAFVYKTAWKYRTVADEDDLVQAGMMGISRALEDFDPGKGNRFTTYAAWWIRAYVQQEAKRSQRAGFTATGGDGVDLRARMGVPELCGPGGEGIAGALEQLPDEAPSPERALTSQECGEALQYALQQLCRHPNGDKVAKVIQMRLLEEKTLQEIGEVLGFSRERARQLEMTGMPSLRKYMLAYVSANSKEDCQNL